MNAPATIATQSERLATGGLVDRTRMLSFAFDGETFTGHPGDTLASALLANGVRLVGRSFKYHRPRGILSAGSEEPNALVEMRSGARREPNTRATTVELYDQLIAASQNRWPSLKLDVLAANQLIAPFLTAGFYYKTFMWPPKSWELLYEPFIRRSAGLGRAADAPDPDRYEKAYAFCDVLVVGGGPAGLSAALAAGRAGARVILCDEDFRLGGRLLAERETVGDKSGADWATNVEAELAALPDVRIMRRTTVFGVYDGGTYGAIERVNDHVPVPPTSIASAWRPGVVPSCSPTTTTGCAPPPTWPTAGSRSSRWSTGGRHCRPTLPSSGRSACSAARSSGARSAANGFTASRSPTPTARPNASPAISSPWRAGGIRPSTSPATSAASRNGRVGFRRWFRANGRRG
jgi:hypothetical protein